MMENLFKNNRSWAESRDPALFAKEAQGQSPKYLWIGCADSRVPPNMLLGLEPGEVFVHRNIANLFPDTDMNCLSVLEYAINYLHVEHVIVCGHYGCGGVAAAMEMAQFGLVDNWLRHIRDVCLREKETLEKISDPELKGQKLVELNVAHQVMHVCHTTIVQNAWAHKKELNVHGWVYDIATGLLKDLNCTVGSLAQVEEAFRTLKQH